MSTDLALIPDPEEIAADAVEQQELFGARVFAPEEVELIRGARRYAHTGTTAVRDERRARAICAAKLLGWSNRKVARHLHCDIRTVSLVVEIMERAGKLPPLKDRLARAVGEAAEVTVERLNEMLQAGEHLDPELAGLIKALWVGAGIGADKLAAPSPTVHLHQHVHQGSGLDAAREYAAMLAGVKEAGPVDSVSTGFAGIGAGTVVDVVSGAAAPDDDHAPVATAVRSADATASGSGSVSDGSTAGTQAHTGRPPGGGSARGDRPPGDDGFQGGTS